ncbi:tryptophan dimethylallyltransferase family protein [Streptomyces sp. MJP52]|uniref:tryptophan dimethylallyltransferase family protein n=1 Tax=Streptomyces sp. MJP52 TaxID=2940555 RepID=UPI00247421B4|nr:tryptophan dimethylallyltransferase family protein [Streptomyces sp. MJP52]
MTRRAPAGPPSSLTLGEHTGGQLLRLARAIGMDEDDAQSSTQTLLSALGPVARRPLHLRPPTLSHLSDDHTPVEFSLSFSSRGIPSLRVLLEPGFGRADLARNGQAGLRAVRDMARRWNFSTERLDELEDLFLPADPQGSFALWIALELRPSGVPKVKVYLNPAASGPERAAATVREALRRLGHEDAFDVLPPGDQHLFFALDLGDWEEPRAKVYLAHHKLSATGAGTLSRMDDGPRPADIQAFFHAATGTDPAGDDEDGPLPHRRPVQTCHAVTDTAAGRPTGFTLYVPVRDYVRHDGEALKRAVTVLTRHGMDPSPLRHALSALTSRHLRDGVGLVAYLGVAHQQGTSPRVTIYLSSEAYRVRPPNRHL